MKTGLVGFVFVAIAMLLVTIWPPGQRGEQPRRRPQTAVPPASQSKTAASATELRNQTAVSSAKEPPTRPEPIGDVKGPELVPILSGSVSAGKSSNDNPISSLVQIPGGTFIMGDVNDTFSNPHHGNDQIPLHSVKLDGFRMGKTEIKSIWYCDFLNAEILTGAIQVVDNSYVVKADTNITYCDVYDPESNTKSLFIWDGSHFSTHDNMEDHPANTIRWEGAVAYCNWLSRENDYEEIYNLDTWEIDYTKSGIRLPTEAEWEYAARGGDNHREYSWGSNSNDDGSYANFGNTGDPYEIGDDLPNSTPVGFYNGEYHSKEDFSWPGTATGYQTSDNSNGYGLQDMSGNSFEWVNDWYSKRYYRDLYNEYGKHPVPNPEGPSKDYASLMPDGIPWRSLRGGSWDERGDRYGHLACRKSGYWRGKMDPTYPYFHFGLRIVLDKNGSEPPSDVIDNSGTNTTGLLYYDQSKASTDGYILYAPKHNGTTYLMNKAGQVLKTWQSKTGPGQKAVITPDGYFYRAGVSKGERPNIIAHAQAGTFEKQTWDGKVLWDFEYVKPNAISHHDYTILPNGNFLAMVVEKKTPEEAIAAGFQPGNLTDEGISLESVLEFAPDARDESGVYRGYKIVWEWHLWDHLVVPEEASKHPELYRIGGSGHRLNMNHGNGIDYNERLNQIALSFRNGDEIIVFEYTGGLANSTEIAAGHTGGEFGKGGDLLYRWGNTAEYGRGDIHLSYSQHAVNWIPEGYPGAGNFILFINGSRRHRQYSTVGEIASQWDDVTQSYPDISSSDAHWGPDSLVWEWNADNDHDIYSDDSSGAQRLKNGNTLISFGIFGLLYEITPDQEIVWKYKCPVDRLGPLSYDADTHTSRDGSDGRVFKVKEYEPDYPGFDGKELTPIADAIELYGVSGLLDGPAHLDQGGSREGRGRSNGQARSGGTPPPRQGAGRGSGAARGIRLLPPQIQEQLNLIADQQKELLDLEAEAKAKLSKILTPEEQQKLQQLQSQRRQGGNRPGRPNSAANPGNRPLRPDGPREGRGGAASGVRLLPPQIQEQVKLAADRQKQLSDLETETKARLNKILTPEQQRKLQQLQVSAHQNHR